LSEVAENVVQDTTVFEELKFDSSVDTEDDRDLLTITKSDSDLLTRLQVAREVEVEGFLTGEAVSGSRFASLELERNDTHTDEVGAVDTFEGFSNDDADALEHGTLCGPIAGRTRTVFLTSDDDEGSLGLSVLHGSIVDGHLFTRGVVDGDGTSLAFTDDLVGEADVGEGTTDHDEIVTTARTVRVEVSRLNTVGLEELGGGRVLGDGTSGGDVIGGDGVSEVEDAGGVVDLGGGGGLHGHTLEVRGAVDVGRLFVPLVVLTFGSLELVPDGVGGFVGGVDGGEEFLGDVLVDDGLNFFGSGPDVLKHNTFSDGFSGEVNVGATSKSEGDN